MNNYYDSGRSRKVAGRGKRNRILAIASLVLAGLVIISYLAPVFYFLGHFQANTTINGDDVSYMTVKQVEELITKAEAVYSLKVTGRDGIETTLTTEDIEMKPVFNGSINELLKKQNKFLWPLSFKKKSEYTEDSVCEYSEDKMKEALKASDFFNTALQKQPENAYYEFGETKYEIVPDVPGNIPDEEKVYTAVSKALDVLDESVDLDKENCYKKAEIDRDNETLNLTVDNLNKYCGVSLFFDFGETSETLDGT
ncbi:MAG: hypothetical protein K6F99_08440, partial [Lachnospiraceae bacterium]|nr:hypothetical protein [Lachnospiraceae bacterium]